MDQPATALTHFAAHAAYAADPETAAHRVADILTNADLVALDLETTPLPTEQTRAAALQREKAEAEGRVRALAIRRKAARGELAALTVATAALAEAKAER